MRDIGYLSVEGYEEGKRIDPQIRQIGQISAEEKSPSSEIC
jgi:hypothetical protein